MTISNRDIVLCVRAAEMQAEPIPGSQIKACRECGEGVIVSPTVLARLGNRAGYICSHCVDPEILRTLDEQTIRIMEALHDRSGLPDVEQPDDPTTYRCAQCLAIFPIEPGSEERAQAQLKEHFPGLEPKDCVRVCDDCYAALMKEHGHA